jgi:hypothetical protein
LNLPAIERALNFELKTKFKDSISPIDIGDNCEDKDEIQNAFRLATLNFKLETLNCFYGTISLSMRQIYLSETWC